MSACCPTCGHGTSGCMLTAEEWETVREATEVALSNMERSADRLPLIGDETRIRVLREALRRLP